jgi:hypothetical protein
MKAFRPATAQGQQLVDMAGGCTRKFNAVVEPP